MTKKHYRLQEFYGNESSLQRYIRLTVGEGAGGFSLIWHELVLSICLYIPGVLGIGLRSLLRLDNTRAQRKLIAIIIRERMRLRSSTTTRLIFIHVVVDPLMTDLHAFLQK